MERGIWPGLFMLSQKAKYAIKALLVLARAQDENLLVQARDISESENIPKKFLDLIFFELRRHSLIVSTRGREGGYSLYSEGVEDQNFLRGVQIADDRGTVTFTSVFPACYDGRWPHIHFEVYPDQAAITDVANAIATSQVALPQDVCETVYAESGYEQSVSNLSRVSLNDDNVFGDDGGALQLATVTGDVASGYTVALRVGVDTTTEPSGGGPPSR